MCLGKKIKLSSFLLVALFFSVLNYVLCADSILYILYTNSNPNGVYMTLENVKTTTFNSSNEIKFILHGYSANVTNDDIIAVKDSFLAIGRINTILVDWTVYSEDVNYLQPALVNTRVAGNLFGDFLVDLRSSFQLKDFKLFHLIGHSLGAQLSGFAGRRVISKTGLTLPRITALDAAKPLFEFPPLVKSLSKKDAKFVDAIHTETGLKGYLIPFGHVDFYPNNGGPLQPGCVGPFIGDTCSHHRALFYYAESIINDKFVAHRCCSWNKYVNGKCSKALKANMGHYVSDHARGVFYLRTNTEPKFALG